MAAALPIPLISTSDEVYNDTTVALKTRYSRSNCLKLSNELRIKLFQFEMESSCI